MTTSSVPGNPPWMVVLPDEVEADRAAAVLRPRAHREVVHASGRPWLLGEWPEGWLKVAHAGIVRIAVLGRCPVSSAELTARSADLRTVADATTVLRGLAGSFHAVVSAPGEVRVQGSLSGTRRVFWTESGGSVVAADAADVLARLVDAPVDERLVALELLVPAVAHPLGERTLWRGVHAVSPDTYLHVRHGGRARTVRRWTVPRPDVPLSEGASSVRRALTDSVASCAAEGGTITADLSGGFDSTSLCFAAARHTDDLTTVRLGALDPGNDDEVWARRAAAHLPDARHVVLPVGEMPECFSGLDELGEDAEQPFRHSRVHARARYAHSRLAQLGSRVHLAGHGGDELFLGSASYLHSFARRHPLRALRRIGIYRSLGGWPLSEVVAYLRHSGTFGDWLAQCRRELTHAPAGGEYPEPGWGPPVRLPRWVTRHAVETVRDVLRELLDSDLGPLSPDRGQHEVLEGVRYAGGVVRQLDRMLMRRHVSLATPYLDDAVIESALAIRGDHRSIPMTFKPVLARAMRGIVPDEILARSSKGEYGAEAHSGYAANTRPLNDFFADSRLVELGLVDPGPLRAAMEEARADSRVLISVEATVGCEAWVRRHVAARHRGTGTSIGVPA